MEKPLKKIKLVVSDFHLGSGPFEPDGAVNVHEEFYRDKEFADWLSYYCDMAKKHGCPLEVIFNGDMMDLLKVSYKGYYPYMITELISLHKVKKVVNGHPVFFETLRNFLKDKNHSLVYVVGNHDQDMLWPKVRSYFSSVLEREVHFEDISYVSDGVYIEHGHMYDSLNRMNIKKFFLKRGLPEPVLNIPYGSYFIIKTLRLGEVGQSLLSVEVRPFSKWFIWRLIFETPSLIKQLSYLLKIFFVDFFSQTNYWRGFSLLRRVLSFRVFPELAGVARILNSRKGFPQVVIFGHTHAYKHKRFSQGSVYLNTGTWTQVSSLSLDSLGSRQSLTYGLILYEDEDCQFPRASLNAWQSITSPVDQIRAI